MALAEKKELSVNVTEITIPVDIEDTAPNVMTYISNTFPAWDGNKLFLVLLWDSNINLDRTNVLVYSEGKVTGYTGIRGIVTNVSTSNTNMQVMKVISSSIVRLRAGDKYLIGG